MIDSTYAKDDQHVFQYGQIVQDLQSHCLQSATAYNNESMMMQPVSSMYSISTDGASMQVPTYEVRDFKVFFDNQYVPGARWIDFTDLGQGYGMFFSICRDLLLVDFDSF